MPRSRERFNLAASYHTSILTSFNQVSYDSCEVTPTRHQPEIDAADITERLVGITHNHLQNFVSRGLHGLRASIVKPSVVRRLFTRADVFGIALVWLLFEGGLRREAIDTVLNDIASTKRPDANLAARKLLESKAESLAIVRQPRVPTKTPAKTPQHKTEIVSGEQLRKIKTHNPTGVEIVISVGHKFRDIEMRMEILFPPPGA
jgi:hypothetical protein